MENDTPPQSLFRDRPLPTPARLAGYAHLIDSLDLRTVLPFQLHAVAPNNRREKTSEWVIHPAPRMPRGTVYDHLVFALKWEGVNLLVLKQVFVKMGAALPRRAIKAHPTSAYARRLCFLYEWLMDDVIEPPERLGGTYVDAVDVKRQYATSRSLNEPRWRVRDNLPGTPAFCPLVAKTQKIERASASDLPGRAKGLTDEVPPELIERAAAFLLLSDSKASFAIESERPSKDRAQLWARVIGRAGQTSLSWANLEAMQRDLIKDTRFVRLGKRIEEGFVGEHGPFNDPKPQHISARAKDLDDLTAGLIAFDAITGRDGYPAVLAAASLAFGFVYIHPFADGNGRIHRYLIHHALASQGFTPEGVVFPVSTAILADVVAYRQVLETVSRPLLSVIDWHSTISGNVDVVNETADFYRYFDATPHAEFLFDCIERTIEVDLPNELRFLASRDEFHRHGTRIVDMPERTLDLLLHMLRENGGRFSKRMRRKEFEALTEEEVGEFETLYANVAT